MHIGIRIVGTHIHRRQSDLYIFREKIEIDILCVLIYYNIHLVYETIAPQYNTFIINNYIYILIYYIANRYCTRVYHVYYRSNQLYMSYIYIYNVIVVIDFWPWVSAFTLYIIFVLIYTYIILLYDTHLHRHNHRPTGGGMVYYTRIFIRVHRREPFTLTPDFVVIILDLY